MTDLGSTPWVDKAITRYAAAIEAKLGPGFVPRAMPGGKRQQFEEYGCGYYGCVLPVADRGVVLKITTDETEAWLAQWLAAQQRRCRDDDCAARIGIVHYLSVYRLTGAQFRRRPVFALWRSEVDRVGNVIPTSYARLAYSDYEYRTLVESAAYLETYRAIARKLYDRVANKVSEATYASLLEAVRADEFREEAYEWSSELLSEPLHDMSRIAEGRLPNTDRVRMLAYGIVGCRMLAEMMENTAGLSSVGTTLSWLSEEGILLADLHRGNLGRRIHGGPLDIVITDPGLAFPTRAGFSAAHIDDLE